MNENPNGSSHSAAGAAIGFYYQTLYALYALMCEDQDDAAVVMEQLDDFSIKVGGHDLLYQLKHSIQAVPPPISLRSRSLWSALKVWIDSLSSIDIDKTRFFLVTVAGVAQDGAIRALIDGNVDRTRLIVEMIEEAERVKCEYEEALRANKKRLPHADRIAACVSFLELPHNKRTSMVNCIRIKDSSPAINEIETHIACLLKFLPEVRRPPVAKQLIEWWDRQVIYSLCGGRERVISKGEIQQKIYEIILDSDASRILFSYELASQPDEHEPDGMLKKQIDLVDGKVSDYARAVREEWRAREQRSRWSNENAGMRSVINDHDQILREHWSDRHLRVVEDTAQADESGKRAAGLLLLRWVHNEASKEVRPISRDRDASYYVSGSYHVLSIELKVGWHPDYQVILRGGK